MINNLVIITMPELHPSYSKLKKLTRHHNARDLLVELEDPVFAEGQLCITDNYIVSFENSNLIMIPIKDILWAYEQSKMHRFLWIKIRQSYNIHFSCKKNVKAVLNGYTKEQLDYIINYLTEKYPDIIIGYSIENRKAVSKLLTKKKDCRN